MTQAALAKETSDQRVDPVGDSGFDPRRYFDQWWQDLKVSLAGLAGEGNESDESLRMSIESLPGSNCEVTFEGVLHFDGHSMGNIRSTGGVLVVTKQGRVDANIDVGVAVINGAVVGNITASERVFLDSDALVKGQIITRRLSMRPGAIFEGDCTFIDREELSWTQPESPEAEEEIAYLLASV